MSEKKEDNMELLIMTVVAGIMFSKLGSGLDIKLMGFAISSAGIVLGALDLKEKYNPFRLLFENLNLKVGDGVVPKYINKRKTPYGYCLTFSLPYGLSTNDFEKHQLAIEQYLNKRVDINYKNYRIYIRVYENELKKVQPYQLIETSGKLEFPFGFTYGNKVVSIDLEKHIHVLIAGETGGGKSTLLRALITSIILLKKPVVLHLIDLKNGAEFNCFRKCKQVKSFSRDIKDANNVLNKLILEVNKRYDLFFTNDVESIGEYNKIKGKKKLDYEICIIDEFADLQSEKDSISSIETLTAKARACGIHLIASTQRPSVNIINGTIKSNIPTVIGLKTASSINSRIVIDENGLEKLRGFGHGMLKFNDIVEFQGMYITTKEVRELIKDSYIDKEEVIISERFGAIDDISFLLGSED